MTGMEVAERKSVMRFLLTISLSALPGSSKDEDRAESWLLKSIKYNLALVKMTWKGPRESGAEADRRRECYVS